MANSRRWGWGRMQITRSVNGSKRALLSGGAGGGRPRPGGGQRSEQLAEEGFTSVELGERVLTGRITRGNGGVVTATVARPTKRAHTRRPVETLGPVG